MEKYGKSFKELNQKEKLEYVIEYYKFHIISGLISIVILFSVLNHYVFNPPKEIIVDVTITAPYLDPKGFDELQKEVRTFVENKKHGKTAQIELLYFSPDNDPQTQMVMTTKLVGKASTKEMDILILNAEYLSYYNENEILLPLSEYLTQAQIQTYAEKTISAKRAGKDEMVAFEIKSDSKMGKLFPKNHQGYFGVAVGVRDIELVKELIPCLLD